MDCSMPGFLVHHQHLELTQTHVHWVSDVIQPSHPLLSPSPPAFNLSQHQVFSKESVLRSRWPKYWSFSFSISPSNECSGLISFRINWLDLLAVQGTLNKQMLTTTKKQGYISLSDTIDFKICKETKRPLYNDKWSQYIKANRRGDGRRSDRFYFVGHQNHCGQWFQSQN